MELHRRLDPLLDGVHFAFKDQGVRVTDQEVIDGDVSEHQEPPEHPEREAAGHVHAVERVVFWEDKVIYNILFDLINDTF